jgi:hypothetical protein
MDAEINLNPTNADILCYLKKIDAKIDVNNCLIVNTRGENILDFCKTTCMILFEI